MSKPYILTYQLGYKYIHTLSFCISLSLKYRELERARNSSKNNHVCYRYKYTLCIIEKKKTQIKQTYLLTYFFNFDAKIARKPDVIETF